MKLHSLTNTSSVLQDKMRFFADYFSFTNEFLGKLPGISFDNPLSLVTKILFQITNNRDRCQKSVNNLLRHFLRYENDYLTKAVVSYPNMKTAFIEPWKSYSDAKDKKLWLQQNISVTEVISIVEDELKINLFDTVISWLESYLKCTHQLDEHVDEIKFATQILVSYFRLSGATKEEIDKYIERILSNDKHTFPLPLEILEQNDADTFDTLCDNFFANRDFSHQFEGLKNITDARSKRKGYFLFPIEDVYLDKDIVETLSITFDKVTFISSMHPKLEALKKNCEEDAKGSEANYTHVFFGENRLLGCVELHYEKKDTAAVQGREIVAVELEQFNAYLNRGNMSLLNGTHFLYTKDFTGESWWMSTQITPRWSARLNKNDVKGLNHNTFQRLRTVSSKASEQITRNEQTFIRAVEGQDVSAYWLYIENLFWSKTDNKKKVKELFVKLAMRLAYTRIWRLEFHIGYLLSPFDRQNLEEQIGLSKEEADTIYSATAHDQKYPFDWQPYRSKIIHPFLGFSIDLIQQLQAENANEQWEDYFDDLVQELYDYRNAELHSGVVNEFSRLKLIAAAPGIITEIRNSIIKTAEENPELDFAEVIEKLITGNVSVF